MASLFILVVSAVVLRGLGWLGVKRFASWRAAVRVALVVMLLFTGASHFSDLRHDFAAMIPDPLPKGLWVIYLTGLLGMAGAIGLLIPRVRKVAGICLVLLLIAMFPANVNAALNDIPLRGEPPTSLWLRLPMQLLYIWAIWWTSVKDPPHAARPARHPQTA
jgi:uncharacterized membrane protein